MHQRERKLWKAWIIGSLAWVLGWAMLFHVLRLLDEPFRSVVSLVAFAPPLLIFFPSYVWVRWFEPSDGLIRDDTSMTKPAATKPGTLLKVAILIVLLLCGYVGFQWNQHRLLTVRSHLVEEQLKRLLPRSGDSVSIENLLPSDSVGSEEVALVCTVTPYQFQDSYPELANLDFGWWFGFGGERWIGVVALDAEGDVITTARLARRKVDLGPFTNLGRCYHPKAANLVNVGSEEDGILLTIEKR